MNSKLGKLDLAHGGTLVLDEIASVDLSVQAKLLNVVEGKQFYRLGGSKSIQLDSRIVALSSVPLAKAVERQVFRQDLFFRLNLITIRIPSLRERGDEILAIAQYLLTQLDKKYKGQHTLHTDCDSVFRQYDFPGNIRELRNALERAVLMSADPQITPQLLPAAWHVSRTPSVTLPTLEDVERNHICEVLKQLRGKKVKAAKVLGISRKTLLEKRKKYGLQ
jgi:transcriptional regulator with PAS, ATPase and Fis domain